MKSIVGFLAAVLALVALVVLASFGGLEWRRYFEPRHAEISREVFEQTPSFVHGKAQHISRLRHEYEMADTDQARASLRTLIKHEAAAVDVALLPQDLQSFLRTL